jgi:HPt (histidine-containing phosphotransfer) domain-containing protein
METLSQFNPKIFLVDDDDITIELYEKAIRNLGFTSIIKYASGLDCINALDEEPKIIFLDQNFVQKMVKVFIEQSQSSIDQMNAAMKAQDFETLRKVAHRMKPSIDNLSIQQLMPVVREIETHSKERIDDEKLVSLINQYAQMLTVILEDIAKWNN